MKNNELLLDKGTTHIAVPESFAQNTVLLLFKFPNILASKNKSNIIPVVSGIFSFSSGIKETVGLGIIYDRVIFS